MSFSAPFLERDQVYNLELEQKINHESGDQSSAAVLPGQPDIDTNNTDGLYNFLMAEFWAHDLEEMASRLWMMTTPSSTNITSLHAQKIKGREIIVTEDPRLHLVWYHNRIFIKPLPDYILSHNFWSGILNQEYLTSKSPYRINRLRGALLGYLRTYTYLMRHKSDFRIGQEMDLVPKSIEWSHFCRLRKQITQIPDADVSGRYHYGEIRLTRLNLYAKFFLRKFYYQQMHSQYADIFGRLYGPILFAFAILSTILSAMQVDMAVEERLELRAGAFANFCLWTSRLIMLSAGFVGAVVVLFWAWIFMDEWIYVIKKRAWRTGQRVDSC